MTYEEAIEYITGLYVTMSMCLALDECRKHNKAISMAIGALEKQMPRKPLHMHKNYYCPICKEDGWILWDDAVPLDMDKYCGKCGQAISWGDADHGKEKQ